MTEEDSGQEQMSFCASRMGLNQVRGEATGPGPVAAD